MTVEPIRLTKAEIGTYYRTRVPKLKRVSSRWRGPCPIHGGKGDNFVVDPETGLWFCHSQCGFGGDIFKLEAHLCGADFPTCKARVFSLIGRTEDGSAEHHWSKRRGRRPQPWHGRTTGGAA
jgi:DNA primase